MIASQNQIRRLWARAGFQLWIGLALAILFAGGQSFATAAVTANLTWTASPAASVTGYNIYYGVNSHEYGQVLPVANATAAAIANLPEGTTYFFAAKAHDNAGNESTFSEETAFVGVTTTPNSTLQLKALPDSFASTPLVYSLGSGAPAGALINPTNGLVTWTPDRSLAATTNYIPIQVTSPADSTFNLYETLLVKVTDYLELNVGPAAVSAGQTITLPLCVAASGSVTNVQFTLNWPDAFPANPALTLLPPMVSGTVQKQGASLIIQLQTAANQPFTGSNQVASLTFQTSARQDTAVYNLAVTSATGFKANAATYDYVTAPTSEVVVIGEHPLLRPQASAGSGRQLTLYANPGTYQVQYATAITQPMNWLPLTTYRQTAAKQTLSLDSAAPVIFDRVQKL